MKLKKNIRVIVMLLVVGLITSAFFIFKSVKDNSSNEFIYYGNVEADKINVSSEVAGKIREIKVQEGSKVKAGDLIAAVGSDENSLKLQDRKSVV